MTDAPRTRMNIRMKDELADRLIKAAQEEGLPLSAFVRKLTRWAMEHYDEQRGSLHGLSQNLPAKRSRGVKSRGTRRPKS